MKLRVVINVVLVFGLLSAGALAAWYFISTREQAASHPPKRTVPKVVAPVVEAIVNHRVEIVGYGSARPKVRLELSPLVSGQAVWKADNFLTGKRVVRGQVLCRLDTTDFEIARDAAAGELALHNAQLARLLQDQKNLEQGRKIEQRRVELAQSQLEKVRALRARGAAAENDVDAAEDQVLARQAQLRAVLDQLAVIGPRRQELDARMAIDRTRLRQAKIDLERTVIRSPVTGRVLSCTMEVGERIQAGQSCGEIYGTRDMEVPVSIRAGELKWLDRSTQAQAVVQWLRPGNGEPVIWQGYVGRIEAGLEAQTRTAVVVIYVKNPAPTTGPAADKPGADDRPMLDLNMFCKVRIMGKTLPKLYLLPRQAVLPDGKVYVVADGKLAVRDVTVARYADDRAMILPGGGISEGDRVVSGYIPKPVPGMRVQAIDSLTSGPAGEDR